MSNFDPLIFDPFSYLDPARARKQIETVLNEEIFDNWSVLDPIRERAQFEAALGQQVFTPFSVLDPVLALQQVVNAVAGGGGYHAGAVTFPVGAALSNDTFVCVNSPLVSGYQWIKGDLQSTSAATVGFALDQDESGDGFGFDYANPTRGIQLTFADPTFTNSVWARANATPPNNTWFQIAWWVDCTAMTACMVLTGVVQTINYSNTGSAFVPTINGHEVAIYTPQNNSLIPVSFSDSLFWIGQKIDWTNPAKLAKILDGSNKPVDPAEAIAEFGTPSGSFYGDAATWATQATAQGFSFEGDPITDATTSPSG